MEHLFVPYEIAKQLKDKGFNDKRCIAYFNHKGNFYWMTMGLSNKEAELALPKGCLSAPLYQQVIDWFREEHGKSIEITWDGSYEYEPGKWSDEIWAISIIDFKKDGNYSPDFQRGSGEQIEYYPTLLKSIKEALKLI